MKIKSQNWDWVSKPRFAGSVLILLSQKYQFWAFWDFRVSQFWEFWADIYIFLSDISYDKKWKPFAHEDGKRQKVFFGNILNVFLWFFIKRKIWKTKEEEEEMKHEDMVEDGKDWERERRREEGKTETN